MWLRVSSLLILAVLCLPAQEEKDEAIIEATLDTASTLVVSGAVERDSSDGDKTLPAGLRMAVDCHGEFIDGGGVSPAGQFRFTMTPHPVAVAASSVCTVEAKVFGYDSTVVRFPVRSITGVVTLALITITRNSTGDAENKSGKRDGPTVSATSLKAPAQAVRQFEQGQRRLQQKKFADAAKSFEAATRIYPAYADAWLNLGLLAAQQSDLATAVRDLDESLRLDPARSFQACYSDALINLMLRRYAVAERAAREALRFGDSGSNARVDFVLGMALLARGGNAEAKQRLVRYLDLAPGAPDREQVEKELARLERIAGAKN